MAVPKLALTSPEFPPFQPIPRAHTSDGEDFSPPLVWAGVPLSTRSLALIVDDPDAPDPKAPRQTWVHWVLYGVPPTVTSLEDGASPNALPDGAREGLNDWRERGWRGPSPPVGKHRYFFKLYALDTELDDLGPDADKPALERAMAGHIVAEGQLVGTYEKMKR